MKTIIAFFWSILLLTHISVNAQSFGFDIGISGSENYGEPNRTFGFSFIMPFNENIEGILSFHQWKGEDDNYTLSKSINTYGNTFMTGRFYGNKGLNLLLNIKYFTINEFTFFFGAGLSQFEIMDLFANKAIERKFIGAVTVVPLYVKMRITDRIGLYTRGALSAQVNKIIPDWGILNIGLELNPF